MSCRCAPALITLRDQLNTLYPHRDKASDGCCGDPAHRARKSDHNPTNGYAHAYDFDEDIAPAMGEKPLWEFGLNLLADERTKYLIYEGRLLYPDGTNKPYSGANPHDHHLHLSIHTWATHDTDPWKVPGPEPKKGQALMIEVWNAKGDTTLWRVLVNPVNGAGWERVRIAAPAAAQRYIDAGAVRREVDGARLNRVTVLDVPPVN